jgi:hypothetical protein
MNRSLIPFGFSVLATLLAPAFAGAQPAPAAFPAPVPPGTTVAPVWATTQDERPQTLIGGNVSHGGFGGPFVGFTRLNGENSAIVGGRGGWLINHRLVIGGGGMGIATQVAVPSGTTANDADHQLTFGYGGFWTEYVVAPTRLVHGSLGVMVGGGGLALHRFRGGPVEDIRTDPVFVIDPTASVELNLVSFVRLTMFVNYRVVTDVDLPGLTAADVSGFGVGGMLKFGVF